MITSNDAARNNIPPPSTGGGEGEGGGVVRRCIAPSPLALFPPGVRGNPAHPFGGEKVHWTFSCFRLTPRVAGEGELAGETPC
jgi:hypothetical protein